MHMRTYDIEVYRAGRWRMIYAPEIDQLTQARHRGEIEDMARSLIAISSNQPISQIGVQLTERSSHRSGRTRRICSTNARWLQ